MKTSWNGKTLLVFVVCLFCTQIALAQQTAVAPRITEAVDETKLVTLKGNVHPLALADSIRALRPIPCPSSG